MKKILLLALFISGFVQAQIVNIPDANFKAKLIALGYDTNVDGNIQQSEVNSIMTLDISNSGITDLTGLEYFTGLNTLIANDNTIASFNFPGLVNLQSIYLQNNALTTLNITGLSNLNTLNCNNNQLTGLNLSGFSNFTTLNCANNQISSLDVSNMSFNVFNCSANGMTTLTLNNTGAFQFYCSGNNLTSLNLTSSTFTQFYCNDNQLSTLAMSSNSVSFELYCYNNLLTELNLISPTMQTVNCTNNLLTSLDISTWNNILMLYCGDNSLLTSIYAKNGRNESLFFDNCPNLEFICVDDNQYSTVQPTAEALGIVCSTYCTFTPGGNYNTATGIVRYDALGDGCGNDDIPLSNVNLAVSLDTFSTGSSVFTNNSGNYNLYMSQPGTYSLSPVLENPSFFTSNPITINANPIDNSVSTHDICISPNGIVSDVEVVIGPIIPARPGFDAVYQIVFKNKGNQILSGNVMLTFEESVLDFVSSTQVPDFQSAGMLSWNYSDLMPFETRGFAVTFNVNSPLETPPVVIGDQLDFTITITPVIEDVLPLDNVFDYKQIVVGSFDPNDITCLEGDSVATDYIGQYLHYGVNFENTGNYPAENIVVRIEIDPEKYDISTIQLLNTSHDSFTRINNNVIEFIFQQIQLDTGGHGNILFKLKTKPSLVNGDVVSKRADIFFDYNAPVDTGMASTLFQTLNTGDPVDVSLSVYPNPSSGLVNISGQYEIKSVQLYDIQGRLLQTQVTSATQATLDISNQSSGVYFVKITTEAGSKVERIIRE